MIEFQYYHHERSLTHIVTLTPSPAIDVSTSVDRISPFTKLRCASPTRDPGGGGINVARVIKRLGGDVTAIYPAGGAIGQLLCALMEREVVSSLSVPSSEETREDITIFEQETGQQYRFVMPGARLDEKEWQQCLSSLTLTKTKPDFVVASGSLPQGVPEDFYGRIVRAAKVFNAKVVVDTSGPSLKAALQEGVYLIKPNLREFRELTGLTTNEEAAFIETGRNLIARGLTEFIALTMGPQGAILISNRQVWRAKGLAIKPVSVVGAGDSFLGALVWSLAQNGRLDDALRYGVAAGSAATLNPGTELCKVDDIGILLPQVCAVSEIQGDE